MAVITKSNMMGCLLAVNPTTNRTSILCILETTPKDTHLKYLFLGYIFIVDEVSSVYFCNIVLFVIYISCILPYCHHAVTSLWKTQPHLVLELPVNQTATVSKSIYCRFLPHENFWNTKSKIHSAPCYK